MLAEKLGLPVGELLQRMSSIELSEWMAFYEYQAATPVAASATANPEAQSQQIKQALFKGK